jgi:hypothetical protein
MSQQSVRRAARRSALDAQAVFRKERADGNTGWRGWRSSCVRRSYEPSTSRGRAADRSRLHVIPRIPTVSTPASLGLKG